jgi:hypothetical protein
MRQLLLVLLVVSACSKGGGSSPVFGWWEVPDVEAAEDLRGGAMKLEPATLTVVDRESRVMIRSCKTEVSGTRVTITGCGPGGDATFEGGKIRFAQGYELTRASAARAKELDAIVAREAGACTKARACYREAWPLLGREVNEEFDFGPGPASDVCRKMLAGFIDDLNAAGKPIPPGCAK